jgi:TetR/AcrR family transcriptional regulator
MSDPIWPAGPPRAGRVRRRNEAAIIAAAVAVFAEKGLTGATTAEIAERAGIPKANLHYYYGTKQALYEAVLSHTLGTWDQALDHLTADADPRAAITAYIRDKLVFSRDNPAASRLFALEVIGGARHVQGYIGDHTRRLMLAKAGVLEAWAAAGKIDPIDPRYFFFLIWAATQTYADFASQIAILLDKPALDATVFDTAAAQIGQIVLKGIGAIR